MQQNREGVYSETSVGKGNWNNDVTQSHRDLPGAERERYNHGQGHRGNESSLPVHDNAGSDNWTEQNRFDGNDQWSKHQPSRYSHYEQEDQPHSQEGRQTGEDSYQRRTPEPRQEGAAQRSELPVRNQRGSMKKKTKLLNSGAMPVFVKAGEEGGGSALGGGEGREGDDRGDMSYGEWKDMMKNRWSK